MLSTYLIIAWFAVPVLVSGALLFARKKIHFLIVGILWLASVIFGTVLLANYVWALDRQLLAEIDKFEPGTPEAELAAEEWASDTDRSFLLLLSPFLTGFWYSIFFLLFLGFQRVMLKAFPANDSLGHTSTNCGTSDQRYVNGNPYDPPTVR